MINMIICERPHRIKPGSYQNIKLHKYTIKEILKNTPKASWQKLKVVKYNNRKLLVLKEGHGRIALPPPSNY